MSQIFKKSPNQDCKRRPYLKTKNLKHNKKNGTQNRPPTWKCSGWKWADNPAPQGHPIHTNDLASKYPGPPWMWRMSHPFLLGIKTCVLIKTLILTAGLATPQWWSSLSKHIHPGATLPKLNGQTPCNLIARFAGGWMPEENDLQIVRMIRFCGAAACGGNPASGHLVGYWW